MAGLPAATTKPKTNPAPPIPAVSNDATTGVPAGLALTDYTGPCTITASNTTINAKRVFKVLEVRATGVVIKNSQLRGIGGSGFTVSDSTIDVSPSSTFSGDDGISASNLPFASMSTEVGGASTANTTARFRTAGSTAPRSISSGDWHASAVWVEYNCTLDHNTPGVRLARTDPGRWRL